MMEYGKYGKVKRLQGFLTRRVCEAAQYWGSDIGFENEMHGRRAGVSPLYKSQNRKPYVKLTKLNGYDKLDNPYENNRLWERRRNYYSYLAHHRGKKTLTVDQVSFQYLDREDYGFSFDLAKFFS